MDFLLLSIRPLHRRHLDIERREERRRRASTFPISEASEICRKSRMHDRTRLTTTRVCSRMFAPYSVLHVFSLSLSVSASLSPWNPHFILSTSGLAQFAVPAHASLEDTHRMHTRAYIRRVLRKLAPYASIQISHLATCVLYSIPTCLSMRNPSLVPFHSSLSDAFVLSSERLTDSYITLSALTRGVLCLNLRNANQVLYSRKQQRYVEIQ